jgi:hypothetical protein
MARGRLLNVRWREGEGLAALMGGRGLQEAPPPPAALVHGPILHLLTGDKLAERAVNGNHRPHTRCRASTALIPIP